jgi:hypothetical protein
MASVRPPGATGAALGGLTEATYRMPPGGGRNPGQLRMQAGRRERGSELQEVPQLRDLACWFSRHAGAETNFFRVLLISNVETSKGFQSSSRRDAGTNPRDAGAPRSWRPFVPSRASWGLNYPEDIAETKAKGLVGGAQRRRRREEAHFRFIPRPPSLPRGLQRRHSLLVVAEVTRLRSPPAAAPSTK